jgi:iron complex transport system ATP-binding protein
MEQPLVSARGLCVSIGGKDVCKDLDLDIGPGQAWAVLGMNGVGKTTLMHVLAGLRAPEAGGVHLRGKPIRSLARREVAQEIGVMFQDTESAFPLRVREAVLEGRHPFVRRFHWESVEDEAMAARALREFGVEDLAQRSMLTLSGGERRLVAAATLFVQDPPVMMLDEPNSHLDLHQQIRVLERVAEKVRTRARAALVILHDVNLAVRFCDHAILLHGDAEVAFGPLGEVLDERSITRLYRHSVARLSGPAGSYFVPR